MTNILVSQTIKRFRYWLLFISFIILMPYDSVKATYDFYGTGEAAGSPSGDLVSDPGTYGTYVLGETIELDACGSTFATYSVCTLADLSQLYIQWAAETEKNGKTKYYTWAGSMQGQQNAGRQVTLSRSVNTNVFGVGTFYIGIHVWTLANVYIPLPNGTYAYTGAQGQDNGWVWSSGTILGKSANTPISVPEPLSALLLLPILAFVARKTRRERRPLDTSVI